MEILKVSDKTVIYVKKTESTPNIIVSIRHALLNECACVTVVSLITRN
jgi:hypothetical protein